MTNKDLFISENSIAHEYINQYTYPYEVLPNIHDMILEIGKKLGKEYKKINNDIWIHESVEIPNTVSITGPCIIDENASIRNCAFIRGNAIIGKNSVLGNSCEIKNAILYDNVQVPHFNYVGDSILGEYAHMGAGSITSNVKSDKTNVVIKGEKELITNLKKVGAFLGEHVEVGCNCVLTPGTIIGVNSNIYPLVMVRGVIPSNVIVKSMDNIVKKENRR